MTEAGEGGQRGLGSSWPWVEMKGAWSTGDYTDDTETRSIRLWRPTMRRTLLKLGFIFHKLRWRWFPPKRDLEMERRCMEAVDRGDCKPLSEVIAELKAKIEEAKRQ